MAQHLRVHPTLMSQIVNGTKEMSFEQAYELNGYLQLSGRELEFFLCFPVQHARAEQKSASALGGKIGGDAGAGRGFDVAL